MSADKLEEIDIGDGDKPRPTFISANLDSGFRKELIKLLKEYKDCFAWDYSEMPGLDRSIVEHRLPIKSGFRPYKQPPRKIYKDEVLDDVKKEVERFVGDSPKGPLNDRGETRLKPAKNTKRKSICTRKAHAQHNHDPGGPRGPSRQHSRRPSSEVRLARGVDAPSGEVRLARGPCAPRAGSASLEGRAPPQAGSARSRAPTRAFPTPPRAPAPARAYGH
jgi:hypothetical protein